MKIFNKKIVLALSTAIIGFVSCTNDFEEINTNQLLPDDEQAARDGLASGGLFPDLMKSPIPIGTGVDPANNYQRIEDMTANNWVGYHSPGRNHWDGNLNTTSYYVPDRHANSVFNYFNTNIMNTFFRIKGILHDVQTVDGKLVYTEKDELSKTAYAVAQIVKIMGMHRSTDFFGPIPYSDMAPGKEKAKYDRQDAIYKSFLEELDVAVTQLTKYGADKKIIPEYDIVYKGDVAKWIKFANSLMLRLAMRVRYADEALATTYITKATSHPMGLIQTIDEAAKLSSSGKYILHNSLVIIDGYGEIKLGATFYSYLKGYNDPRMSAYFKKGTADTSTEDFYAIRSGIATSTGTGTYANFSRPTVVSDTPMYWMKASEVYFLLAEAALKKYISSDTAENYYKKGIELSFAENGVTSTVTNYLASSGVPANYSDTKNAAYDALAVSTINKQWSSTATEEQNLERIITQKYIALYPNGLEAWSEWRRTGYPRMFKVPYNLTNKNAKDITISGADGGMRRFPFPRVEFEQNTENVNSAKSFLGGADNCATNVWWDKKENK